MTGKTARLTSALDDSILCNPLRVSSFRLPSFQLHRSHFTIKSVSTH